MLRLLGVGWAFHLKSLTNSLFFVLISVIQPVIFASIAFYMFEAGGQPGTLLYAALGAGMMGIWSSTLFGSGGAIQWHRWQGTLELLVAAPPPFLFVPAAADARDVGRSGPTRSSPRSSGDASSSAFRSTSRTRCARGRPSRNGAGLGMLAC